MICRDLLSGFPCIKDFCIRLPELLPEIIYEFLINNLGFKFLNYILCKIIRTCIFALTVKRHHSGVILIADTHFKIIDLLWSCLRVVFNKLGQFFLPEYPISFNSMFTYYIWKNILPGNPGLFDISHSTKHGFHLLVKEVII